MLALLRSNRPLRRLLVAWLASCLGTGAGYVALLLLTTSRLHSSWAISGVLIGEFLPAIALGSWLGALADRYSKRALIIVASLVQAAAFAGLALAHGALPILLLALLAGIGNAMQRPAIRAALPLLAPEHSQGAAAVYDTVRWFGVAVGPLFAALLFALSGVRLAFELNAASFFVVAVVIATVAIPSASPVEGQPPVGSGIRAGLRAALAARGVTPVIACSAGQVFAGSLLNVCEPVLATVALKGSGTDYALLVAAYGAGMVAASAVVALRGPMPAHVLQRRYVASLLLGAAGMTGSALVGSVELAGATFAVTGYSNSLLVVSESQIIMTLVSTRVQGRIFGAKDAFEGACMLAGLVGAGGLVAAAGVRAALGSAGGICAACALAAAIVLLWHPTGGGDPPVESDASPSEVDVLRSFP